MKQGIEAELWLQNWNESANGGCKLIFEIGPDELEPFKALRTRSGKKVAGQRFAAVLVLIDDDESVVPAETKPTPRAKREESDEEIKRGWSDEVGFRARLAVLWCDDERFQQWIAANDFVEGPVDAKVAKRVVCDVCSIGSRKELDTDEDAWDSFCGFFRSPYMAYLQTLGVAA
jgi:hypothetical protein